MDISDDVLAEAAAADPVTRLLHDDYKLLVEALRLHDADEYDQDAMEAVRDQRDEIAAKLKALGYHPPPPRDPYYDEEESIEVLLVHEPTGDDIRNMPRELKEEAAARVPRPTAFFYEETEFGPVSGTKELQQPSVDFLEFSLIEPRFMLTQATWEAKPPSERIACVREAHMPRSAALSNDMTKVLPLHTRDYLEFWQKAVNDGSAWNTFLDAELRAIRLLQEGYLLYGHCAHTAPRRDTPARADVPPSQPGSAVFVEARMGEEYARWIEDLP